MTTTRLTNSRKLACCLLLFCAGHSGAAQSEDDMSYKFDRKFTTYTFTGNFKVDCNTDNLRDYIEKKQSIYDSKACRLTRPEKIRQQKHFTGSTSPS